MSLDVSALSNYTEQNKMALITKATFGAKTIKMMTPQTGIKSSATINILDTDAVFQTGGGCGFSASGSTAITQRTLTVGKIKVHEAICPKDLEAKYTQLMLQAGSQPDKVPFEQLYAELKAKLIGEKLEVAIWQGDTTSGDASLNKFDGLIKQIGKVYSATGVINNNAIEGTGTLAATLGDATYTLTGGSLTTMGIVAGDKIRVASGYVTVLSVTDATHFEATANAGATISGESFTFIPASSTNFTTPYTAFTNSNAQEILMSIYNSIPATMIAESDLKIFIGLDWFKLWQANLTTLNLFHYTAESANFELTIPGTNIKVVAVNGLTGTNRAFAMRTSNMYYGCDMENEEEKFSIKWAEEAQEVRYIAEWKSGCNVAFLHEIVQFTLA